MNPRSGSVRSLRILLAMLGLVLSPALVRGAPSDSDSAVVAPAGATDAPAAPTYTKSSVSPLGALCIGLAATAGPTLLAYGMTGKDTQAENIALTVGVTAGVVVGPAVGLWSGGRGDLANKGLLGRALVGGMGLGAIALASATWNDTQDATSGVALVMLGVVSAAMVTGSVLHDLAITPSATAQGRRMSAGLGICPNGMVAVNVRF